MIATFALLLWCLATAPPRQASADEAAIRTIILQYFGAQEAKDADRVVSLWSESAKSRPTASQLAVVFQTGDDTYTATVTAITVYAGTAQARVAVKRVRTIHAGGITRTFPSEALTSLTFVREGDAWKINAERPVAEEIVDALVAADAAERTRLLAEPGNNIAPVRQSLAGRASMLAMRQQYAAAQALYEVVLAAARAAHDQRAESETLHNIGNALYFQRDFAKAGEYYQERLALARQMNDDEAGAAAMMGVATIAYTRGEYTPALDAYRAALGFYERTDATPAIGATLVGIGNVQYLQAEYEPAAETYRRALTLLEKSADVGGVTLARSGLARVYTARGDLGSALQTYQQILDEARASPPGQSTRIDIAAPLESVGELHYRLGNVDQARTAFDEARRLTDARQDFEGAGRLLGDLGLTELVAGKFTAALADYVESRGRFEKAKSPAGVARAWVGIGFSHSALEKFPDAIAAYKTAIAGLDDEHLDEESARAWLGLSMAQSGGGDLPSALESARHVAAAAEKNIARDLKWRAAARQGEVLRTLGRLPEAQRAFEDAIAAIQELAADLATNADVRTQLDGSADAWAGLAFTFAQRGDSSAAVVAEEQRRAHLRRLYLAPFERDIVRGATPAEQEQELQNTRDLISTRVQLRAERGSKHPDAARIGRLQSQITALVSARAAQQAALYARLPDLRRWRGVDPSPDATQVNALLSTLAPLVIEYVVRDEELLILTAAHGDETIDATSAIVPVRRRELVERVAAAIEPASLGDAVEWRKRSAPLVESLITPVVTRLSARDRCIVVPDEVLWRVPFEALSWQQDDSAAQLSVTYGTSLTSLAALRDARPHAPEGEGPPGDQPSATLGVVVAPDISPSLRAQLAVTWPAWPQPDSAGSMERAKRIAALYGASATVTSGADATKAAARSLSNAVDVLQLDAPFQTSAASPLFSSAVLAGGDTPAAGRWELREWFADAARVRVLILQDGTALSSQGTGSALDALSWAAAASGISTVATARPPRDAYSNDALLAAWHERLAKSIRHPLDALRDATAAVRSLNGAPSAWAGLRVIGVDR